MPVKYRSIVSFTFLFTLLIALSSGSAHAFNWSYKTKGECHRHDASTHHQTGWSLSAFFSGHWHWSHHCNSNANAKPSAKAGVNQTVDTADTVLLDGSQSTDSDGTIASYRWSQVKWGYWPFYRHERIDLINADSATASFEAPSHRKTRNYLFRLKVTDNEGSTSTDYVRVKVRSAYTNPKVTIEGDSNFESGDDIELTAKLQWQRPSTSYSWTQLSGPAASFSSPIDAQTVSIQLPSVDEQSTLVFQVEVQNGHRSPGYATKTITVEKAKPPTSTVSGRIVEASGTTISGVNVTAIDKSGLTEPVLTLSGSDGVFAIELGTETEYVLQLTAPNYSNQVVPVISGSANGEVSLSDLVMILRSEPRSISLDGEQTISSLGGASVTFDKANFVNADGQPIDGDMELTVTSVDVSNSRVVEAFPGLFLGIAEGGVTPEMIVSLGATEFHFTHNGEPVNLASGATADVLIPIYVNQYPNGQPIETGQTAPLRSLNEATGIWSQEGVGTVVRSNDSPTGLAYQATVSHFSWWGIDVAMATPPGDTTPNTGIAYAIINVNGPPGLDGVAVIEATASGLVNWKGSSVNTAVDIGDSSPSLPIPANRDVCFIAYIYFTTGAISETSEVCENAVSEATVNLNIDIGVTGPLDVVVTPELTDDTAFIQGFDGITSPALRIAATTIETTVTYALISGTLPAGLSLDIAGNVLTLIGTPTTVGEETFVIRATDADSNTDDVTITYNVSAVNPPPIIEEDTNRFFVGEITTLGGTVTVNLNSLVSNIGGPVSQWREATSTAQQTECTNMYISAGFKGPSADLLLPGSVSLAKFTGELTFTGAEFWLSCLVAFNNQGTSVFMLGFEITDTSI